MSSSSSKKTVAPEVKLAQAKKYNEKLRRKVAELKAQLAQEDEAKKVKSARELRQRKKAEANGIKLPAKSSSSSSSSSSGEGKTELKLEEKEEPKSSGPLKGTDDLRHSFAFTLGNFTTPAAAITASLEFKHVVDEKFRRECTSSDPIGWLSVDFRMKTGHGMSMEDHRVWFERLIAPVFDLPDIPAEISMVKLHVGTVGSVVRVSIMIPNPKTAGELGRRKKLRQAYAAAVAARKLGSDETLPEEPPVSDDDILKGEENPLDLIEKLGIDWAKYLKKVQVRIELAHNLKTFQVAPELKLGDLARARVGIETCIDPSIITRTLDGVTSVFGDPGPKKLRKAQNLHFISLLGATGVALSLGNLNPLLDTVFQMANASEGGSSTPTTTEETELRVLKKIEDGESLGSRDRAAVWQLDTRRAIRLALSSKASRSSYRYDDYSAIMMVFKILSTLVSKDIEEVTGVHARARPGWGVSVAFDNVLLFPAVQEILSDFTMEMSREVKNRRAGH